MYPRAISPEILQLAGQYPVVTITGPRQSGKTTLVRYLFPGKPYSNLEAPDVREKISSDPRAFFESISEADLLHKSAPKRLSIRLIGVNASTFAAHLTIGGSVCKVIDATTPSGAQKI